MKGVDHVGRGEPPERVDPDVDRGAAALAAHEEVDRAIDVADRQ